MSAAGTTSAENVMIDGLGIGDIGNIVLRDGKIFIRRWDFRSGCHYQPKREENHLKTSNHFTRIRLRKS